MAKYKFVLYATFLALFMSMPSISLAARKGTPYEPKVDQRFDTLETEMDTAESDIDALEVRATASEIQVTKKFTYDTVAGASGAIGTYSTGVTLPAKAVIIRSYLRIITQFTDAGSGTVALHCEDANNIKTATDITGSTAGAFVEGASTGAASAFVSSIGAACTITATVAGADQTAGKFEGWVTYVLHE